MDETIKYKLIEVGVDRLQQKIHEVQAAINLAEEALWSDTKSSAGDKFETGREMAQQEIARNRNVMTELTQQLSQLQSLNISPSFSDFIKLGSLVKTNRGIFFISVALGSLIIDEQNYMLISAHSPLGKVLIGKHPSNQFEFMGNSFIIQELI